MIHSQNRYSISLIKIFFLLISASFLHSIAGAQGIYTRFSKEQLKIFVPSDSRVINSLTGNWERSYDNGSSWETVSIPYSEIEPQKVRFRRAIKLDKQLINRYNWFLQSLGINEEVELYVNSKYVGRYFTGMAPFSIRLPESKLQSGINTIEMLISPSPANASRHIFAQRAYSGIVRELLLVGTPHVWLDDIQNKTFFTQNLSACQLHSLLTIRSSAIERLGGEDMYGELSLKKIDITVDAILRRYGTNEVVANSPSKQLIMERDRSASIDVSMRINNPSLWSPGIPNLYELSIRISRNGETIDDYTLPVGLYQTRTGSVNNRQMLILNNQPFELKAVDYYEHMNGLGNTITSTQIQRDILSLKTLGVNAIRIRYGNPHPYLVHQCNINGIFILSDLPFYDAPNGIVESDDFSVRMNNIAVRMLNAYDRQPCILGYGISDGLQEGSQQTKKIQKSLGELFRSYSNKFLYKTVRFGSRTIDQGMFDFLIVRSSPRWQPGDIQAKEIERLKALAPGRPMIVHFGKPVQPQNLNGYSDPLSVEAQAQYLRDSYRTVQQSLVSGLIVWSFSDFVTARAITITDPDDQFINTTGLTDLARQPRLSYAMLKALLNDEKEPLLRSGTVNSDTPLIFIFMSFALGIAFFVLLSKFRRLREYIIRALIRPYNFYSDIRDQRLLSIGQTMSVAILSSATLSIVLSTMLFVFRSSFGTEYLYMILLPTGWLRSLLNTITWTPELGVVIFTLVGLLSHVFAALIIQLAGIITRARIFFVDAFTISVWSALPYIILLPIALALFKVLSGTGSATWLIVILGLMFMWYYLRILRSTSVVFDLAPLPVYITGSGLLGVLLLIIFTYYSSKVSLFSYLQYYLSTFS